MSPTTLDDAMAALAADTLEDGEHPSPDELLAYQAGELDDALGARLREHLAWCSECARTVVDLAAWPDVELRDPELERTATEEADDWQAIRKRLGLAKEEAPVPAPVPFVRPPSADPAPARRAWGPVHLLAAALLLAVVGLSVQMARLSRRPPTPQANVFVVDLEPAGDDAVVRTSDAARETKVPAGMGTVVFLLVRDDVRPFDDHAVELRGADGEIFWQTGGLVRAPEGGFSVAVPVAALPSDDVEIRLYGVGAGGERELLATYRTRVGRGVLD